MEKKILTVYTGGTICTAPTNQGRELSPTVAKRALLLKFGESDSQYREYCEELFEDSCINGGAQTLSENMTLSKLENIISHIKGFDLQSYRGVIILHGTDTLAFSASVMAFAFSDTPVPIMLVSGNRPPMDEDSNATDNFKAATELIMSGIAPNVYVPYKNSDGTCYLHLGSRIMQCRNYSEDFYSVGGESISNVGIFDKCRQLSISRTPIKCPESLANGAMIVMPYTGLDYSRISLDRVLGIVHGSYHSGTVCVERNSEGEAYSAFSVLYLANACKSAGIPLFIAPSRLDSEQYSSVYDVCKSSDTVLLDMTLEAAYAKLVLGISLGMRSEELEKFMLTRINNEICA